MKSQYIKIRNVPEEIRNKSVAIHVKPWVLLDLCLAVSIALLIIRSYMAGVVLPIIILTVFALVVMPDRILVQFTPEYLIMYNKEDRTECTLIYWDEIVSWKYEYHTSVDLLKVTTVDDNTESVEMYSKWGVRKFMNLYAPGKEVKRNAGKKK